MNKTYKTLRKGFVPNNTCKLCGGKTSYYHGVLGYEAFVCGKCGAQYTHTGAYTKTGKKIKGILNRL